MGLGVAQEKPAARQEVTGKSPDPYATCGILRGAVVKSATASDPPRVDSALNSVTSNSQELLPLLDTGCEVAPVSETKARRCSWPVHSLARPLRF